jgi:hypothetical protein
MTRKTFSIQIASAVALVLALAACSGGDDEGASGDSGGGAALAGRGTLEGTDEGAADEAGTPVASAVPGPGIGPRIIQTASLRLVVARGGFDQAIEEARNVAGSLGGFVVSSSESRDPGAKFTTGALVLRIPNAAYADAMSRLDDIGKVSGREESGQDVSAEFVDLEARKRHLEAVETQLLKLLQRADDVPAALAVQAKLDDVQLRLEEVRGRLRFLDDQTAFATISLALRERAAVPGPGSDDGGILDAWADGARAFVNVAAGTFVVLATIAPVLLLLALVGFGLRVAFRRGLLSRRRPSERAA